MSQNAIVKKVVHPGVVEVSLMRQMECGLSCSSCEGCPSAPRRRSWPWPLIRRGGQAGGLGGGGAASGSAIGFALLVFFLPCVFLLGGYLIGRLLGSGRRGFHRNGSRGAGPGLRSGGPDQPDHHPAEDPGIHRAGVSSQRVRRALCLDMSGLSGRN